MHRATIAAITMLSMLAAGIARGTEADAPAQASIASSALLERIEANEPGFVVLDVRAPEEYAAGHVPRAVNIPHDVVAADPAALSVSRDTEIIVYCRSGRRAAIAIDALREAGFERVTHLTGDMLGWEEARLPVETPPDTAADATTREPADP